jgi:hypothetical protein
LEASLGLAVAGVFEGVNWNLRALAERKEPIVVPQLVLVLGGLKLVSEGDTNKSELVLAKENGRGGLQVLQYDDRLPPSRLSRLMIPQQEACSESSVAFSFKSRRCRHEREALNPSAFNSFDCFKEV